MRVAKWGAIAAGLIAFLLAALLVVADSDIGHRFIVDRVAALAPKNGLKIRIGRIEGSIYGDTKLRDLRLSDPDGLFFSANEVRVDWSPFAWIGNRLDIDELTVPFATLHRLPKFAPTESKGPILPGFDIRIGRFEIARLRIGERVAGEPRLGRVTGSADIRSGRAMIALDADAAAGDRLALKLDARPDGDVFDLQADLIAPAGGVFGAAIGTQKPVALTIRGDGSWTRWQGSGLATVAGARVADLALTADKGRFGLDGRLALATITEGKVQRLTGPAVRVKGEASLENRRLRHSLRLTSAALAIDSDGTIDLAQSRFDGVVIGARLLQPAALFPNMSGRDITLKALIDGPFAGAYFDYLLTSPFVAFDATGIEQARASGRGRWSKMLVTVPLKFTARRVTGVGDVAGGILANLSVEGPLLVSASTITGDGLLLKSDKLTGRLTLFMDLKTGRYDIGLAGQLNRYLIPGLGIVDVKSELKVVPGQAGRGTRVLGRGQAWVRRFDNSFLAGLAGGLPYLETGLERGPDGVLRLFDLKIRAPALTMAGSGERRRDGTFSINATGRQARYGPFRLALEGDIARPKIDLLLASPNEAAGLRNVRLLLDPISDGFAWRANGGSSLGPFTGNGRILLPRGAPAVIEIAALNASGLKASGSLRALTGGLEGRLTLAGSGISGTLDLAPQGNIQRIEAHLAARDARLEGPPLLIARRGKFDGVILLDPAGTTIDGTLTGQGLQRGGISLARLAANIKLRGGVGEVRASFAGSRGRSFDIQTVAQIFPNRIEAVGSGTVDRRPIKLDGPAVLVREGAGWRLQPTRMSFAGGQAQVAGLFGPDANEIDAKLTAMPLAVLDVIAPGMGLGGSASGTLAYRQPVGGAPSGRLDMRVRGLTRSGLVLTSRPVDVGITGALSANSAAVRAVAVSGGKVIGRGQARVTPSGGGDLIDRLSAGPMFAQIRFNGAADTLWRLTGVEGFDVTGPVAIGADIRGTADNPVIQGSVRTAGARIESPLTGMVLTDVRASGRFGGSSLTIDSLAAKAGGGSVTGRGAFDFRGRQGIGMDLALQADNATLLARDDIGASITGPVSLKSDGAGGIIEGDVVLDKSSFRLGRATAAQAVPRLNVREINGDGARVVARAAPVLPWRLAFKARAPNRLNVSGLGIESEWRADLDIGGTVSSPAIKGRAELVRGGYEFAGRRFELTRGLIRFQGESPPDPILDITAAGDTQGINATIRVTGTGQRPEIAFTSVPALPQEELLARLLFGTSITNLSAPEALQLAAAVASLSGNGSGLNPINTLRDAVGLDRLRILPADTVTGQGTSVAAGKYITRRTYVEVITDGQGYSATRAEFQITRWLSVLSTISTLGRQTAAVRVSKDY